MKIKVLTFFNNANIGSELQAYAMKEYLISAGYTNVTFVKRGYYGKLRKGIALIGRKIKTLFLDKDMRALSSAKQDYSKKHAVISTATKEKISKFSRNYLKSELCTVASMKKQNDSIFLCGSDQIWSPLIYPVAKENFLAPINRSNKIAYAPSFGINHLPTSFKQAVRQFVCDFDFIAMREGEAAKIVSEMSGREIQTVVDPVFLINESSWYELSERSQIDIQEAYVFCYFLDEPDLGAKKNIKDIVSDRKLVYICYEQYFKEFENSTFYDVDPADFLRLIRNSDMVITDSFHATAFSIIFEKGLKIYSRNQPKELHQDGRIRSLLKCLDIPLEIDNFDESECKIEYPKAKQKLFDLSEKSRTFLLSSLQKIGEKGGTDVS